MAIKRDLQIHWMVTVQIQCKIESFNTTISNIKLLDLLTIKDFSLKEIRKYCRRFRYIAKGGKISSVSQF